MRSSFALLALILCAASNARADAPVPAPSLAVPAPAPPKKDTGEELPDPNEDKTGDPAGPAPGEATKAFPIDTAPKLPLAGKSINVGLPEKKQGSSLLWKPRWRKFSTGEWVITGVGLGLAVGSLLYPVREDAWRTPGFLFDEPARNTVRIRSEGWRLNIRDTSDVLLSLSVAYPFLVDSLLVAWWHRGSPVVAEQMAMMNIEAMAITAGLQGTVSALVSRERPYGRDCTDERFGTSRDCIFYNRYRSFFSGHTSQAFTSAMLTCSHHANLPLYGSLAADRLACITNIAVAVTISSMRMFADMHYASDVITGAVIGSAVGLIVPMFHYRSSPTTTTASRSVLSGMRLIPMPTGLAVIGVFG